MSKNNTDYPLNVVIHSLKVSTENEDAQLWFDRGLNWMFGFNHEEAINCFREALKLDENLAMAHWGIAVSSGPNYNNQTMTNKQAEVAFESSRLAKKLMDSVSDWETDLICAVQCRYAEPSGKDLQANDLAPFAELYATSMEAVLEKHPNHVDIMSFAVEAMMQLKPWKLFAENGTKIAKITKKIIEILERGLKSFPKHPGLCHLQCHVFEMSSTPHRALKSADVLRSLDCDIGHLKHMPAHIDVLVGAYDRAIDASELAIQADDKYASLRGAKNFYTLYRLHDLHMLIYAAMFDGRQSMALGAADKIIETTPKELLYEIPNWVESFMAMKYHVLIRFGLWTELMSMPFPVDETISANVEQGLLSNNEQHEASQEDAEDERLAHAAGVYQVTYVTALYAKAMACAVRGDVAAALRYQQRFERRLALLSRERFLFNNRCVDVLAVHAALLDGELKYREAEQQVNDATFEAAFDRLRIAVQLYDGLDYEEPWGVMQPVRHALAALLLEQNHLDEAIAVYNEDLKRNPKNAWSLVGLQSCLQKKLKNDDISIDEKKSLQHDLKKVEKELPNALKSFEHKIKSSCKCSNNNNN